MELYHGDCSDPMRLKAALAGRIPAAIITDIPYNISQKSSGLRNLNYGAWDHDDGLKTALAMLEHFREVPHIFMFCADRQITPLLCALEQQGRVMVRTFAWRKINPSPMNAQRGMVSALEFGVMGALDDNDPSVQFGVWGKLPRAYWENGYTHNFIEGPRSQRKWHKTEKPLWLMEHLVKILTPAGGLVFDPFMGGASTLVAANKLGRPSIGIERGAEEFANAEERCSLEATG